MKKITEDHATEQEKIYQQMKKEWQSGGQPGAVTISGVLVTSYGQPDERIILESKGGTGKDDKTVAVLEENRPKLKSEVTSPSTLSELATLDTIAGFGCSEEEIKAVAAERALKSRSKIHNEKGTLVVQANTILICGEIKDPNTFFTFLKADTIILKSASLQVFGSVGAISLQTNHLQLVGECQITSMGLNGLSSASPSAPSLSITVEKSLSTSADGRLKVTALGHSYIGNKK